MDEQECTIACREKTAKLTSSSSSKSNDGDNRMVAFEELGFSNLTLHLLSSTSESRHTSQSASELYELRIPDPNPMIPMKQNGQTLGILARYNLVSASVVAALKAFKEGGEKEFFYLEPVVVKDGQNYPEYRSYDWNESSVYRGSYYMKHEWKNGRFNIISAALWDDYTQLLDMTRAMLAPWDPEVHYESDVPGFYGGGVRVPDILVKPLTPLPFPDRFGPASVAFEVYSGYMSPRQLRANLRLLFDRHPPQTARHAVLVQVFPDDWSAAAVQWRRDEAHPEGFQLVAALDFGVGALSAAAKALYTLEQPAETHMPAVPQDRWVRHAVVADDQIRTACSTRRMAPDPGEWEHSGAWYENANSPGHPQLFFPKEEVLNSPLIPEGWKQGHYEIDFFFVLLRVMCVRPGMKS